MKLYFVKIILTAGLTLACSSCKSESSAKTVAFSNDISVNNVGEDLEIYKNGALVLKVILIGNAGQVTVVDSGDEISKLHWFYGSKKLDSFQNLGAAGMTGR